MIGYYIHHQGRGHLNRARAVCAQLREPVTALSTLEAPGDWDGEWLNLADDSQAKPARRPTANGTLHWVPLADEGLRSRMAAIASWIATRRPRLVVCDVSVEVALLCRLMGTAVATVALPGRRDDDAHAAGYRLSDLILVPWPGRLADPSTARSWGGRAHFTGAFSRFDGRRPEQAVRPRSVTVLLGEGGSAISQTDIRAARAATPGWEWLLLGPGGEWQHDPWQQLCSSEVVVTHAGQNAVAEVAAARRPAIVIPQDRPFDEQAATGRMLAREGLAIVRPAWPRGGEWADMLADASEADGGNWVRWSDGYGAHRAARAIDALVL